MAAAGEEEAVTAAGEEEAAAAAAAATGEEEEQASLRVHSTHPLEKTLRSSRSRHAGRPRGTLQLH